MHYGCLVRFIVPYPYLNLTCTLFFKVKLSPSKKNNVICFIESPLKMMKKCFLFHLKSSFGSQDI